MKVVIAKLGEIDAERLIKRCGYAKISARGGSALGGKDQGGQESFVNRLTHYHYPRFHVYIERDEPVQAIYTIHLDQKAPSYEGCAAHSGEYEGELVEKEAARIKQAAAKEMRK